MRNTAETGHGNTERKNKETRSVGWVTRVLGIRVRGTTNRGRGGEGDEREQRSVLEGETETGDETKGEGCLSF